MTADILALAINPDATRDAWTKRYTYHLDLLPPLMEVLIWMTYPSIPASRLDTLKISGGGDINDIAALLATGATTAPLHDATHMWGMVVDYVHAVAEWIDPARPAPSLDMKPNADPLIARGEALTTAGWLIDHAELVEPIRELDDYETTMFALIRQLRARYGVFSKARRPKRACTVCGERTVTIVWVNNPNGSPKPIQAGRCSHCGQVYTEKDGS